MTLADLGAGVTVVHPKSGRQCSHYKKQNCAEIGGMKTSGPA